MDRFLENNTVLRILALILAVALWFGVNAPNSAGSGTGTNVGISLKFPKDIQVAAPSNMVVTSVTPSRAAVVVREDPQNVATLPAEMLGVSLVADAQGLAPGTHQVRVAAVDLPTLSAQSYSIQPATIEVTLAPRATNKFPVTVQVSGSPQKSYGAGAPTADVTSVQVSGAKQAVSKVAKVVASVSVNGMKKNVTHVATLVAEDATGHAVSGVTLDPSTATVTVPIHAPAVPDTVEPQIVGAPAAGYAVAGLTVKPEAVQVSGNLSAATPHPLTVNVPVDVTGLRASRTLDVQVPLQNGVTHAAPATVAVTVDVEPVLSRTFQKIPIQVQQVQSGEHVKFSGSQTLTVSVSGPKSVVSQLTASQITAYIDASALNDQSQTAQVDVLVPQWIQVAQVSPSQVGVQVTGASS